MHKQAAERIPFFIDKDAMFITNIIPILCPVLFNSHEQIYATGEMPEEIYFIVKGKVGLVHERKNIIFCTYTEGRYFGDIEVVSEQRRKFSAKAIFSTNLLVLNSDGIGSLRMIFRRFGTR